MRSSVSSEKPTSATSTVSCPACTASTNSSAISTTSMQWKIPTIATRPYPAFGNSTGDRQMLEYTGAGDGARLAMLVLHDDATREYAYGPARGLRDSKVGTFTQTLYDEAQKKNWVVISMKTDWKRVFPFDP